MTHEERHGLMVEKYKRHTTYLLHIETIRLSHLGIYLSLLSIVFGIFTFLFYNGMKDGKSIQDLATRYSPFLVLAAAFTSSYGLLQNIYFVFQKRNYDYYRGIILAIEKTYGVDLAEANTMRVEKNTVPRLMTSVFLYWYILMIMIASFPFAVVLHIHGCKYALVYTVIFGVIQLLFYVLPNLLRPTLRNVRSSSSRTRRNA